MASMQTRWSPSATVAAIVHDGSADPAVRRFLLVEEHTPEGLQLNNPAGHLDPGESPEEGVVRETLEETACVFTPQALVGIYMARFVRLSSGQDITYLRFAYSGTVGAPLPGRVLDSPVVRTVWMTLDEIRAAHARMRSELVLQCIEDHVNGAAYPLGLVHSDFSLRQPVVKR